VDPGHVAPCRCRGIVGATAALPGDHVGGVPVPPVVRRGDCVLGQLDVVR
jgi:hypothetical protein